MAVELPKALRRASSHSSCMSSHANAERNARVAVELPQSPTALCRACSRPSCINSKFSYKYRKEFLLACSDHQVAVPVACIVVHMQDKTLCSIQASPAFIMQVMRLISSRLQLVQNTAWFAVQKAEMAAMAERLPSGQSRCTHSMHMQKTAQSTCSCHQRCNVVRK